MAAFSTGFIVTAAAALKAKIFGAGRWQAATLRLRSQLQASRQPLPPAPVDLTTELAALPRPVQRWLTQVLTDGQPRIAAVTVRHSGRFNTRNDGVRWRPFRSEQRVVIGRPGFLWDARISILPGLSVHVHDAYVAGRGLLHAAIGGLVKVAHEEGSGELARGELMRWAAEAAWYPTALLPGPHIAWSPIDDSAARLRVSDGPNHVSLRVQFDEHGLIQAVQADDRPRIIDGKPFPTAWRGRFWNYQRIQGMCIPLDAEATWLGPGGPLPYWRGHIEAIEYEFAS